MVKQWGLVLYLDNIILNNYWRKYYTYLELGWDDASIKQYLSQKQYLMQVASFSTPTVTFSASSRRNRFYSIYNRLDLLDQDVAYGESINGLKKLALNYDIFVISARSIDLKDKTLDILTRLGFPMESLTIFFKKGNEQLHQYRKKCLENIHEKYKSGVGISLQQTDIALYERFNFTPIAFTSVKEKQEFDGKVQAICQDWNDILMALNCH
ncbi:hypothetical protein NEF87_004084 [Candidatus Lokiarchaeum ossiferum]|uniref:Haloacid dehalogenase-like hydrolase n=1 Tax=Candidatus Lokiarchaeum ossiferum TaxID=2951803 RepID=A0ABY6HWA2_9ARCH|nr:hypothetical protein NEF87_004084 [Candidatus Lokiarchaeum sp. B-35]